LKILTAAIPKIKYSASRSLLEQPGEYFIGFHRIQGEIKMHCGGHELIKKYAFKINLRSLMENRQQINRNYHRRYLYPIDSNSN
jgi:hypothetical protein